MAKRRARLPRILRADEVAKRTLGLSADVDRRLSFEAKRRGVSRSLLAGEILDGALPRLRVDDSGRAPGQGAAVA